MIQGDIPERIIYKGLNDLHNLQNNKNHLSDIEYMNFVRKIITRVRKSEQMDILSEVKQKTYNMTNRFENRILIEQFNVNKLEQQSMLYY